MPGRALTAASASAATSRASAPPRRGSSLPGNTERCPPDNDPAAGPIPRRGQRTAPGRSLPPADRSVLLRSSVIRGEPAVALPLARAMPTGRRRDTASLPPSRASRAPWPCAPQRERLLETHHLRRADCAARGGKRREPLAHAAAPVRRMHLHRVGG